MNKQTKDLILLNMMQDIGHIRLRALLAEFKTTESILKAPIKSLQQIKGIGPNIAESIKKAPSTHDIDRELSLIKKHNVKVVTIFDKDYPEDLKNTYDPPIVLYTKGELKNPGALSIAIVGSRRCTQYGLKAAQRIARELSAYKITIVSGMARGIDTAAHKGAMEANAQTIAVLGNGLASIYPPENRKLACEIIKHGMLVSEFCMEMPPHKQNFPRRNRVISGLSKGVVVVEAAAKSGALITADFALDEGRDVFAVPGGAGYATSQGTNNLIREGAKLAESASDIIEELGINSKELVKDQTSGLNFNNECEEDVYNLLSDEPKDIEYLTEAASSKPKKMRVALLQLEIKGLVKQLPGKLYVKA
ncbi:MAG: DNA-protecting protein DprA [Candidatus Omnitrophica bacterium]|nr:DNA-protecting protein DprA [Candidatus Omnitrophota bacterium]